ncbi:hypothetical protein ACIBO1_26940 [Micromonospora sp. NPDC049903]|uniref:hypothetical protein n=1 Tax=Micromonospora sp. NPDC049903 TaxID=3364276 RepID=UPI0037B76890
MSHTPWLEDRRWRWRVVVLLLVLIVIGTLIWLGYEPLAAVGATAIVFVVAAHAAGWIINDRDSAPPPPLAKGVSPVDPAPAAEEALGGDSTSPSSGQATNGRGLAA